MKFNKWTLGLAAVGAVSLASAVRADEAKMSQVQTALSNTTISGYVSTSINWLANRSGDGDSVGEAIPLQNGKQNGFNLDVVKLTIAKPQDDSPWASGYQVDLLFGPDAVGYNPSANSTGGQNAGGTSSDFAIQQAYVALRTPVGNGIDWKIGVFNTVVGYESFDAGSNPNYTRSWGWAAEPTEHTGILASYKVSDELSLSAGVANTLFAGINTRNNYNAGQENTGQWDKTVMGSATFTAPSNWGWASGSAFYVGDVYGFAGGHNGTGGTQGGNQNNFYAGATVNSPWKDVTFGAAFDYVQNMGGAVFGGSPFHDHANAYIFGLYN
ncbi:MAG TPA: outer membrane beta-barrel protein, partial [Verrucomicrobiae bacterium]